MIWSKNISQRIILLCILMIYKWLLLHGNMCYISFHVKWSVKWDIHSPHKWRQQWTHWKRCHMALLIWVNTESGTKLLPDPVLTHHQCSTILNVSDTFPMSLNKTRTSHPVESTPLTSCTYPKQYLQVISCFASNPPVTKTIPIVLYLWCV